VFICQKFITPDGSTVTAEYCTDDKGIFKKKRQRIKEAALKVSVEALCTQS